MKNKYALLFCLVFCTGCFNSRDIKSNNYHLNISILHEPIFDSLIKEYRINVADNNGGSNNFVFQKNKIAVLRLNCKLNYRIAVRADCYFNESFKIYADSIKCIDMKKEIKLKANIKNHFD